MINPELSGGGNEITDPMSERPPGYELVNRTFAFLRFWFMTVVEQMELYYKDLISEEASLEKLVDDLMLVVQGAEEFAQAAGANLNGPGNDEIKSRLARLKERCRQLKQQTVRTALAADKVVRQYPYSGLGFAFGFGLLAGAFFARRR